MVKLLTKEDLRRSKKDRNAFLTIPRNPIYVVLDSLKCAHNIGTILRLADSLLVTKVYLCGKTIIPPNWKIKVGSRGAERWVPWEYREDVLAVIQELKSSGIFIVSAELTNESITYSELKCPFPACLVLGREYDGVSEAVLNVSDAIVSLPLFGMSNSLNVSTTASVILYEMLRQLHYGLQ